MVDASYKPRSTHRKACFFCEAVPYYKRNNCPGRKAISNKCSKKEHFPRTCQSRATNITNVTVFSTSIAVSKAKVPGGLSHAATIISINGKMFKAFVMKNQSLVRLDVPLLDVTEESWPFG